MSKIEEALKKARSDNSTELVKTSSSIQKYVNSDISLMEYDEHVGDDVLSKLKIIPETWLEKTFTLPFQFSIKGANDILGFEPLCSFEDGMKKTEEWWRHCRGTELDVILAQSIMSELTVSPTTKKTRSPS